MTYLPIILVQLKGQKTLSYKTFTKSEAMHGFSCSGEKIALFQYARGTVFKLLAKYNSYTSVTNWVVKING